MLSQTGQTDKEVDWKPILIPLFANTS